MCFLQNFLTIFPINLKTFGFIFMSPGKRITPKHFVYKYIFIRNLLYTDNFMIKKKNNTNLFRKNFLIQDQC